MIELTDGRIIHRHVNHIRTRTSDFTAETPPETEDWTDMLPTTSGADGTDPPELIRLQLKQTETSSLCVVRHVMHHHPLTMDMAQHPKGGGSVVYWIVIYVGNCV